MGSPRHSNHLPYSQTSANSTIKCFYTNADCLLNKLNELKARLSIIQPDILAITEVCPKHFTYTITSESLHLDGYDLFCSDLSFGRGVCIYCKSNFKATKFDTLNVKEFNESLWCSVPVASNGSME